LPKYEAFEKVHNLVDDAKRMWKLRVNRTVELVVVAEGERKGEEEDCFGELKVHFEKRCGADTNEKKKYEIN
jgi:hypothetical protein